MGNKTDQVGWRVKVWHEQVGLSRSYVYKLIDRGELATVKVGSARVITVSPQEFIDRHRELEEL